MAEYTVSSTVLYLSNLFIQIINFLNFILGCASQALMCIQITWGPC